MQSKDSTCLVIIRAIATLALLATCGLVAAADQPPDKKEAPKPLPANIVTAWKDAQAQVGWVRVGPGGAAEMVFDEEAKPGDIPAFVFIQVQQGRLPKLPDPGTAFGLFLPSQVTDAGLKEIAGLKSVQLLSIGDVVVAAGMAPAEPKVTDAGLKELAGLAKLQTLYLTGAKVSDAGLKELAALKTLQWLFLDATQVTDAGLKELGELKALHALFLAETGVTDAGLKELAALKSLHTLDLSSTQVTDAGMKELAGLKDLQALNVTDTKVTDAGLAQLRKALPRIRFTTSRGTEI
jgi:internalin A